jgi:hypothetical protein
MGYFMCGNDLFKLDMPMCEKLTYIALCRYAGSNNRAWPSYERLAGDVSCSKRRAIQAVKKLCSCGLVKKEKRGNRTNVYVIYPAQSFKACAAGPPKPQDVDKQGAGNSPPPPGRVQILHPEGEDAALPGCKSCTLSVQQVHPKNNKINNKEKYSSSSGREGPEEGSEEREKNRQTEKVKTETIKTEKIKTVTTEDIEQVRRAFKGKKVVVKDSLIVDLLSSYSTTDVCGAIRATNFDLARNPINVIRWMLRENSYCMPLLPAAYSELHDHDPFSNNPLHEEDHASVKQMIQDAKNNLLRRTAMTLQPIERF